MGLSNTAKRKVNQVIFERAHEIEQKLSADDCFLAKIGGIKPDQISKVALKCAVKQIKKEMAV